MKATTYLKKEIKKVDDLWDVTYDNQMGNDLCLLLRNKYQTYESIYGLILTDLFSNLDDFEYYVKIQSSQRIDSECVMLIFSEIYYNIRTGKIDKLK